jgi:hypothetical protein
MIAGPSSSRRNERTRSSERVINVFGRSSTGKPAKYILDPARVRPSGSFSTITPARFSRRPKSMAGLIPSRTLASRVPAWGLLRRKTTSNSSRRAVSWMASDATSAFTYPALSRMRPGLGRVISPRTSPSCPCPCESASTETNATSWPRRKAAKAKCAVVYVGRWVRTELTTKQRRIGSLPTDTPG